MAEWPCFSQVFEAVPHCFIDSNGGLIILQNPSSEDSSVRRLQPQDMKKGTPSEKITKLYMSLLRRIGGRDLSFLKGDLEAKPWQLARNLGKEGYQKKATAQKVE